MTWRDPSAERYQFGWQHAFALSARARGMKGAAAAQRYISQNRAMHRRLRRSPDATWNDWKKIFRKPGWRNMPERWLIDRNKRRLDKALKRGDDVVAMERRGLFDTLKSHQKYRGAAKLMKRVQKDWRR